MGRKSGKSGRKRDAAARGLERGQFEDPYQMASWFWQLLQRSWQAEAEAGCVDCPDSRDVLSLALHVRAGEWALGVRGPRLGEARAPWEAFPIMERVRLKALEGRDDITTQAGVVERWPSPPLGFTGSVRKLPTFGAGVVIDLVEGGVEIKLEEFSTRLLAHPEWPTNDLTWADGEIFDGVNWRWSGLSREQEAMEAEGLATAARAFRAMAFDLDLDFGGGRGTVGSESGCDSEDCSSGDESDEYFENYYEDFY